MKKIMTILLTVVILFSFSGCTKEQELKDGYYTAHMEGFAGFGWQEFVTICVNNGEIVTVEYNATTPTGFIKSWDTAYMRVMNPTYGTYPNRYTREYAAQLLEKQSADIDAISGATESGENFKLLVEALLEKARAGDSSVAVVSR